MSIKQKAQETKAKIKDFYHRHERFIKDVTLITVGIGWGIIGGYVAGKEEQESKQILEMVEGAEKYGFATRRNRITNQTLAYAPHLFQRDDESETFELASFSTQSSAVDGEELKNALLKTMSDLHCWPEGSGTIPGTVEQIDIWSRYKEE